MDRSSADAFVYAKASGILAKSFVGERANKLFAVNSLQELWALVFQTDIPAVPEIMLAKKIEQEAEKRFLHGYISLLRNYSNPEAVLLEILHFYDFDNLKDISASLSVANSLGEKPQLPLLADIAEYSMLNYKKWPNIAAITANSPLSWCQKVPEPSQQQELDSKLDVQYIRTLWKTLQHLPSNCRSDVTDLIQGEMILNNILWALRLRVYYGFSKEQVLEKLVTVQDYKLASEIKSDPIAGAAVRTLDWELDSYSSWSQWKYAKLLNPHEEGVVWQIDPRWIQQSAKVMYNQKALRYFHRNPFSAAVLVAWFKIKQYELDCIRTVAEGLRLNVGHEQVLEFAGLGAE